MIETKEVGLYGNPNGDKYSKQQYELCHGYIDDLTAFGWQLTQKESRHSGRFSSLVQILARETSMPNYEIYRKLEIDYETAKGEIKHYSPMEASTVLLFFLLFIFPCIIYVFCKINQRDNIEINNKKCKEKMQLAVSTAKQLKEKNE